MTKKNTHNSGFTLIELLVVISIIGLLSSVVLAAVNTARGRGGVAAGQRFDQHNYAALYDNVVAAWSFDETIGSSSSIPDEGPNGSNLIFLGPLGTSGIASSPNPFRSGNSFYIVPASGSANSGNLPAVPPSANSSFAVSFWIYLQGSSLVDYVTNAPATGIPPVGSFIFRNTGSAFAFEVRLPGSSATTIAIPEFNKWNHIMGVCNNSRIALYVNGKLAGAPVATGAQCQTSTNPVRIGGSASGSPATFFLDNLHVYNQSIPL